MSLNLKDTKTVSDLALILYDFLPGSGNNNTSFPLAAHKVGIGNFWIAGPKKPAIVQLLTNTLERQSHKLTPLIEEIVRQSMTYRSNKDGGPTREEIVCLNEQLAKLNLKIPDLNHKDLLDSLPSSKPEQTPEHHINADNKSSSQDQIDDLTRNILKQKFEKILNLEPNPRGKAFEGFLKDLFDAYNLAAKKDINLVGEQIDGSFVLDNNTYLLEAKWTANRIGQNELLIFNGKVTKKTTWARGLFISESGFTEDGLRAFATGHRTSIICMDGLDLYSILNGKLNLVEVIKEKNRKASETGRAFTSVRELFPSVV